ncbi:MAG: 3-methyl-2-oxobutanoate hydroxymethyltransferase, partial [Hyphomicrobiaceae bacterium]
MAVETPIPRKRITAPEITARKGGEPIVSLTS